MNTETLPATETLPSTYAGRTLFLTGFLVLFLELACIRWFAAYAVFLQFFTNVILLAAFLGMSCGCLAARSRRDWLASTPIVILATVVAAIVTLEFYQRWSGIAIDVGQSSPQEVFFGTEYRNPDVARFVVPIDAVVAAFFVAVALMFVGLGQALGRAFAAHGSRIRGYMLNLGGSVLGIVLFSALSLIQAPPWIWFAIALGGVALLLHQAGTLTRRRGLMLTAVVALVAAVLPVFGRLRDYGKHTVRWSPYYVVDYNAGNGDILVNTIGHQQMIPFASRGSTYSLIHLLRRSSGGSPFQDMLVIGAGSGNDLAHALKYGVSHIDAVEIDPVIQSTGIEHHPDHPYQDSRVVRHLDDGRHFVRTTDRTYDLVVYALVDSLVLHSGYANIRLESYLFTDQAFVDIKRILKPGGLFVTYNYFRQGWIVTRAAAMIEKAFGCPATVISLPYVAQVDASTAGGFTMIIGGCDRQIVDAFRTHEAFWLNRLPERNLGIDGFAVQPAALAPAEQQEWAKIAPSRIVAGAERGETTTDDWPFLYLRGRLIPTLNVRSMIVLGGLGLGLVSLFTPGRRLRLNVPMFALGAAFMLLESKAVVQLALLFGSTWLVNSAVFLTVLLLILLANIYVLTVPDVRRIRHYAALFLLLGLNLVVPLDTFLAGGVVWRYVVPCALALGPMFFAGVIFALMFRDAESADEAFGSNIAGAVVGGLSESFSMVLGFRYLLLFAVAFYIVSMWTPALKRS